MRLRQAAALLLSTDLHAVAARLQKADTSLQDAQEVLGSIIAAAPPEMAGLGLYDALEAIRDRIVDGRVEVVGARADLTGRGPEKILDNPG